MQLYQTGFSCFERMNNVDKVNGDWFFKNNCILIGCVIVNRLAQAVLVVLTVAVLAVLAYLVVPAEEAVSVPYMCFPLKCF